jgi:pimeloyl-ACP methyl ester carboxylesterase
MPKIKVNDLTFHYWMSGTGPEVVVLVHGLGGNLAGWHLAIVPDLQRDYRVLTYDLRGHGRSDAPPAGYTTGDMVKDLRGLLDALDIEKAVVVGHSWGADVALHFALLHPARVTELVIVEGALLAPLAPVYRSTDWAGWAYVTETIEVLIGRPIPEESRHDLEFLVRQLIEIPIMYGPAQGRPRDEEIVFRVLDILRPMWEGREAEGNMSIDSLSKIALPTLLIGEANSVFAEAQQELAARLPSSTSAILPGAKLKHFSSLEHPELILSNMRDFLRQRRPALAGHPAAGADVAAHTGGDDARRVGARESA